MAQSSHGGRLSAAQVEQFERDGYIVVPGVLSAAECEAQIDEVWASHQIPYDQIVQRPLRPQRGQCYRADCNYSDVCLVALCRSGTAR